MIRLSGQMLRIWPYAVLAGIVSALFILMPSSDPISAIIPKLLVPLPLLMAGFGLGFAAFAGALIVGTVLIITTYGVPLGVWFGIFNYLLLIGTPCGTIIWLILARRKNAVLPISDQPAEWYSPSRALLALVALGLFAILIIAAGIYQEAQLHVSKLLPPQLFSELLQQTLTLANSGFAAKSDAFPDWDLTKLGASSQWVVSHLGPALIVDFALLWLIFNALLAQGVLARFNRQIRSEINIRDVILPRWFGIFSVLIAVAAIGFSGSAGVWVAFIARNILLVFGFAYFFQGLGLLHIVADRSRQPQLYILMLYMLVLLGLPESLAVVTVLGVLDQAFAFRGRMASGLVRR